MNDMSPIIQGSAEWIAQRIGKVTASRVADVVAKTKSGYSASRANYMAELVIERLTGRAADRFVSAEMAWGTEKEPEARERYEFMIGAPVAQTGFIDHPTILMAGASPDGRVGDDGLVEIKCPNSATHLETLLSGKVPARYYTQMTWQIACERRAWCDYVSFDPRFPPGLNIFIKRHERDPRFVVELETEVRTFLAEVDQKVAALHAYRRAA